MTRSNSKMATNQCATAGEFVDEVVDNGALQESDPQSKPVPGDQMPSVCLCFPNLGKRTSGEYLRT